MVCKLVLKKHVKQNFNLDFEWTFSIKNYSKQKKYALIASCQLIQRRPVKMMRFLNCSEGFASSTLCQNWHLSIIFKIMLQLIKGKCPTHY